MAQTGVNVQELVEALKRKGIPLPYEMGTFIVLEVCERVVSTPVLVQGSEIWLSDEGEVSVVAARRAQGESAACNSLVELLGQLLVQSAPGVPALLLSLVERGPSAGEWSLRALRDDLEAALVPLNRAATRRVLSRLLREARRDRAGRGGGSLDESDSQGELDDLLGVDPDEPGLSQGTFERPSPRPMGGLDPAVASHAPAWPEGDLSADEPSAAGPPTHKIERARPGSLLATQSARQPPQRPPPAARSAPVPAPRLEDDLSDFDREAGGSGALRLGLGLMVAAALLVVAYLWLGREGAREALGMKAESRPAPAVESAAQPHTSEAMAHGQLKVSSSPERAQVLMYVGQGPVVVEDLPIGVAHEFVALAEGAAPARAVVPPDAQWQQQGTTRRYELALQTAPAGKRRGQDDLGATTLPQEVGTPSGELGSVRVITSPPGARVYLLIGFTPDVQVDNLAVDEEVELLLYLKGHELVRQTVAKSAFSDQGGKLVAELDIELPSSGR